MARNIFCILIIFLTGVGQVNSQKDKIYQFSGLVIDRQTRETVEFATIIINNRKGTVSDKIGRFSILVHPYDTVSVSSIGYKRKTLVIPDSLESPFYNRDVYLFPDTIPIAEVEILPWATYEDFIEAVLELDIPNEEYEKASKNLALIKEQVKSFSEPEPGVNFQNTMRQNFERMAVEGTYPTTNLLNPFAWAKFIQAIKNGEFKRKD